MADNGFVNVYSTATGKKHRVPSHFLEQPAFSARFRKTPKQNAAETRSMSSATPGTDVVAMTPEHPTTPADTSSANDTPAAGDKE